MRASFVRTLSEFRHKELAGTKASYLLDLAAKSLSPCGQNATPQIEVWRLYLRGLALVPAVLSSQY
jgi:hypothetical protein